MVLLPFHNAEERPPAPAVLSLVLIYYIPRRLVQGKCILIPHIVVVPIILFLLAQISTGDSTKPNRQVGEDIGVIYNIYDDKRPRDEIIDVLPTYPL